MLPDLSPDIDAWICYLIVLGVGLVWRVNRPGFWVAYSLWRLEKPNATELDRHRAQTRLERLIELPRSRGQVIEGVADALARPGLGSDRAEDALSILLQYLQAGSRDDTDRLTAANLIRAVRHASPPVRYQLHLALVCLTESSGRSLPESLRGWRPKSQVTVFEINQLVSWWRSVWPKPPGPDQTPPPTI